MRQEGPGPLGAPYVTRCSNFGPAGAQEVFPTDPNHESLRRVDFILGPWPDPESVSGETKHEFLVDEDGFVSATLNLALVRDLWETREGLVKLVFA